MTVAADSIPRIKVYCTRWVGGHVHVRTCRCGFVDGTRLGGDEETVEMEYPTDPVTRYSQKENE